jgi:hypothetical protein
MALPDERPGIALFKDLCLDARDHQAQADWWCGMLGYIRQPMIGDMERPLDWPVPIYDPLGSGPLIWLVPVPEAKVVKNRMHIDVFGRVPDLIAAGATLVRAEGDDRDWDVMADPEGNEFCVFSP